MQVSTVMVYVIQ